MDTIVKLLRSTKGRAGALEEQGVRFLKKRSPQTRSSTMRFSVKHSMSKAIYVLGLLGAAFTQTGCAHPVMVQPSVMIQPSVGYAQVYGHAHAHRYPSAPVVVVPRVAPPVVYGRPPLMYAPPVYVSPVRRPVYGSGHSRYGGHESGHDRRGRH
jgi:hypothetical protein